MRKSKLAGMNDAQKAINLLERIEFQLEAVLVELRMAREDRGSAPPHLSPQVRQDRLQQLASAIDAWDSARLESMKEPEDSDALLGPKASTTTVQKFSWLGPARLMVIPGEACRRSDEGSWVGRP
jgi:hypothetical protein